MVTRISNSPEETLALGESWGREAPPGLVVGLTGELGTGKTQLVKGIAKGLGITTRVVSPSFALVNEYLGGRLPLFHLDLYRLDTPEQVHAAGLVEYLFSPTGVAVVEWIERWSGTRAFTPEGQPPVLAEARPGENGSTRSPRWRWVVIASLGPTVRRISYEDTGS